MIARGRIVGLAAGLACAALVWVLGAPAEASDAGPRAASQAGQDRAIDHRAIDFGLIGQTEWTRDFQRGGGGRGAGAARRTTVNRNATVNRGATVNRRTNVNVNARRTNVNVVRRPVRVWAPRPYYGRIVGGVALGAIIVAAAASVPPAAPAPGLCWFWADSTQTQGYWDYC